MGVYMYVKYLNLINFRNYNKLKIELCSGTNIFEGDNAQGKTNILEALYYSSIGKSHRTNKDKELILLGENECYLSTYVVKQGLDKRIEIKLLKDGKKAFNVNSVKINKMQDLIGVLNAVMFSPEDLNIVKDSPAYRRKFLDIELCKINKRYYYSLSTYKKVLSERNNVLKKFYGNDKMLDIYDISLAEYGGYIISERFKYVEQLNLFGKDIHSNITQGTEEIQFEYLTQLKNKDNIKEKLYDLLVTNRIKDIEKKITSIGPHRDDFSIEVNKLDVKTFGSQGQQRTSVLTIKFASLNIIKSLTGEYPLLLLDDVLSELDTKRQQYILNSIKEIQTLITCTGIADIEKNLISNNVKVFRVNKGVVEEDNMYI